MHCCLTVMAVPVLGFKVSVENTTLHGPVHSTHATNRLSKDERDTRNISSSFEKVCELGAYLKKICWFYEETHVIFHLIAMV